MKTVVYILLLGLCLDAFLPAEAAWFKKVVKKVGDAAKKVGDVAKKVVTTGCKAVTGVACKNGIIPGSGLACVIGKASKCRKRRGDDGDSDDWTWYPVSDDFDEYDDNDDDFIEYEEFAFDFLARFKIVNPEELRIVFGDADADDDGRLSKNEFLKAAWDFGSYKTKVKKTPVD